MFGIVLDTLALVRLRLSKTTDIRSGLSDKLLVYSGDVDLVWSLKRNLDTFRNDVFDIVGKTKSEDKVLLLKLSLVTNTYDDQILLVSFGNAYNHVVDELSCKTMGGLRRLLFVLSCNNNLSLTNLYMDCWHDCLRQFSLWTFNGNNSVFDGSLDRLRHIDW